MTECDNITATEQLSDLSLATIENVSVITNTFP